jgi:Zn-dependent oligopeptidase
LQEEKQRFEEKLTTPDQEISFDLIDEESTLDYYWSYINHLDGTHSSKETRKIIEEFEPKLVEYANMVSYSTRYFEILKICLKKVQGESDKEKILTDAIRVYEVR